jgi:hypothetical protein
MSIPSPLKRKHSGLPGALAVEGVAGDLVMLHAPRDQEEDADVLDVVAALFGGHDGGDAADVGLVGGAIEVGFDVNACLPVAHVGCVVVVEADVFHALGVAEDAEELDGVGSPSGGVAG